MIKNEKGFTLIELIATVAIMLIIVSIAIPTSIKFINDGKEREYELIVDKIEIAAQEYYRENNVENEISLDKLINYIDLDQKYFDDNKIIDPRNGEKLKGNVIIQTDPTLKTKDKVKFQFQEEQ